MLKSLLLKKSGLALFIALVVTTSVSVTEIAIFFMFPETSWSDIGLRAGSIAFMASAPIAYLNGRVLKRNYQLVDEMAHLVNRDRLTDVASRDFFFAAMETDAYREGVSLMIDIDFFKQVNDQFGHLAGDEVISHVAQVLKTETRPGDIVCRFGGEEFVVYLQNASQRQGLVIGERLRRAIEVSSVAAQGADIAVTISIGATLKDATDELDDVIRRADEALYRAKASGRNQLVFAEPVHEAA